MALRIRRAIKEDTDLILYFIKELAIYEKEPDAAQATREQIDAAFFCENPRVYCDLLEIPKEGSPVDSSTEYEAVGFTVWFLNYSTWQGVHGIYLEDLFVLPSQRGKGYGKAALRHLAKVCVDNGYGRFQWSCLDWNTPSIDFYRSIGAFPLDEWTTFRLTGKPLEDLANGNSN